MVRLFSWTTLSKIDIVHFTAFSITKNKSTSKEKVHCIHIFHCFHYFQLDLRVTCVCSARSNERNTLDSVNNNKKKTEKLPL